MQFDEPALLVGETGCGKTSVCQVISQIQSQRLRILNCHMNTETADFLGGLRPARDRENMDRLFEWCDGPLIEAMKSGHHFLVDEISLADDSVLERLNSLLEPAKTILLAEKGANSKDIESVVAASSFRLIATMNPGGDYGKKELSPALRNRFTEIWCPPTESSVDVRDIVDHNVCEALKDFETGKKIAEFAEWLAANEMGRVFVLSIRDVLTWVKFMNRTMENDGTTTRRSAIEPSQVYVHGASTILLDALSSAKGINDDNQKILKTRCLTFLTNQVGQNIEPFCRVAEKKLFSVEADYFGIDPFYVKREISDDQPEEEVVVEDAQDAFSFSSPTPLANAFRILRAMQLRRPIMLEGSPGVGKTSLVAAIAAKAGRHLVRINLSEQTDISDLFGADLPVEGGVGGQFAWRDGPFLRALKKGNWIVLDELNLASQSVLEGLNACLDHRGEVFVPELGKTFHLDDFRTRIFACQNPMSEGGGRKGLPKSFLNRFTRVFTECLEPIDLEIILSHQFPEIPHHLVQNMVAFNSALAETRWRGSVKWEFNLRDLNRWCSLLRSHQTPPNFDASQFVGLVYLDRFCTREERSRAISIYKSVFNRDDDDDYALDGQKQYLVTNSHLQIGHAMINRRRLTTGSNSKITSHCIPVLESLIHCVNMNWMPILVGEANGKSTCVKLLASLLGQNLEVFSTSSTVDTTELLGGFEQFDSHRHLEGFKSRIYRIVDEMKKTALIQSKTERPFLGVEIFNFQDCLDEITRLLSQNIKSFEKSLKDLEAEICQSVTKGSCAGTFEWIDSILVKAMKNGDWILLDDVNLCNPSVLDRLNAFLEPNGSLSIHERGISTEERGREYIVEAHHNFRLFLTMDNRFGELSRAMRNRGLEIAVHNLNSSTEKDLHSILHHPLEHVLGRNILMKIQTKIPLSMSSLVQIAKEINSKHIHGLTTFGELQRSISSALTRLCHNHMQSDESDLDEIIKPCDFYGTEGTCRILPSAADFIHNPEGFTLDLQADYLRKLATSLVGSQNTPEELIYFPFASLLFLNLQSTKDGPLRAHWLSCFRTQLTNFMSTLPKEFYSAGLISMNWLMDHTKKFDYSPALLVDISQLPQDIRWFPSLAHIIQWQLLQISNEDLHMYRHCSMMDSNRSFLILFVSMIRSTMMDILSNWFCIYDKNLPLPPLITSYLVYSKEIANEMCPVIFRPLYPFLSSALDFLKKSFSRSTTLTDSSMPSTVTLLRMIKCFMMHCLQTLNKGDHDFYDTKLRWKMLKELMPLDAFSIIPAIGHMETMEHLDLLATPLFETARSIVGYPQPFQKGEELSNYFKISQMKEYFKMYFPYAFSEDRTCFHPHFVAQNILANDSLHPALKAINSNNISSDEIEELEHLLEQNGFNLTPSYSLSDEQLEKFSPSSQTVSKANLWPISDHFELLLKLSNFSESEHTTVKDDSKIATTSNVIKLDKSMKKMETFLYFLSYLHARDNSPWVKWSILSYDEVIPHKTTNPSFQYPTLMPHPFLNATLTSDVLTLLEGNYIRGSWSLSDVPIQSYQCKLKQIEKLKEELWTNGQLMGNTAKTPIDLNKICLSVLWSLCKIFGCTDFSIETNAALQVLVGIDSKETQNDNFHIFQDLFSKLLGETDDFEKQCKIIIVSSFLMVHLVTPTSRIDPVEEIRVKLNVKSYELAEIERELEIVHDSFQRMNYHGNVPFLNHPYVSDLIAQRKVLIEEVDQLKKHIGYRPASTLYSTLVDKSKHNLETLSDPSYIWSLVQGNETLQIKTWLDAQLLYVINLRKEYYPFPDLITPVIENISLGMFFLHLLTSLKIKNSKRECGTVAMCMSYIPRLVSFPYQDGPHCLSLKDRLKSHTQLVSVVEITQSDGLEQLKLQCLSSYLALNNHHIRLTHSLDVDWLKALDAFQKLWSLQIRDFDEKEALDNAFYRYSSTEKSSDEVDEDRDIQLNFPTYHEQFEDLSSDKKSNQSPLLPANSISNNMLESSHIEYVVNSFSNLDFIPLEVVCVFPPWAEQPNMSTVDYVRSLKSSLLQYAYRCRDMLKYLLDNSIDISDYSINQSSVGLHLTLCQDYLNYQGCSENPARGPTFDIYYDSCVKETIKCISVLESAKARVLQLLDDFPCHPLLTVLLKIIHRIMHFPSDAPIIKFLTGLEFLVSKMKDWEQNAAKHVKLQDNLDSIYVIIIEWRKMELNQWQNCLEYVKLKSKKATAKWWFYLNQSLEWYLNTDASEAHSLILTLQKFMESALLGDFSDRLALVYHFHKKFVLLCEQSGKHHEISSILGNIFAHYSRFVATMEKTIHEQRLAIEKNLQGFIKILRWTDMNYWGLREATFKTHRYLLSQMRAFEKVLLQPSHQYMNLNLDTVIQQTSSMPINLVSFDVTVTPHSNSYLSKMIEFCTIFTKKDFIRAQTSMLDESISEIIETSSSLRNLKANETLEKDKQLKEVKHILRKKQSALTSLFHFLKSLGLTYKKGIVQNQKKGQNVTHKMLSPLLHCSMTEKDQNLMISLRDCERYYFDSLSLMTAFIHYLSEPSKELGLSTIDRLKGFIFHLEVYVNNFRNLLQKKLEDWQNLQVALNSFSDIKTSKQHFLSTQTSMFVPPQEEMKFHVQETKELICESIEFLVNLEIILEALPQMSQEEYKQLKSLVTFNLDKLNTARTGICTKHVYGWQDFEIITIQFQVFEKVQEDLKSSLDGLLQANQLLKVSLGSFIKKLSTKLNAFAAWSHAVTSLGKDYYSEYPSVMVTSEEESEGRQKVLKAIENLYKHYQSYERESDEGWSFSKVEEFSSTANKFTMSTEIYALVRLILAKVASESSSKVNFAVKTIENLTPFLDIYGKMYEHLLHSSVYLQRTMSKMLYILLTMFSEIMLKGFCKPQDIEDEQIEGESKSVDGMGLGDGDVSGAKDVSEEIVSEDQLEEARKQGEEEKDQDPPQDPSKDEEHGIEMSEDFDAEANDMEDNNDGEDNENAEDELDKQMGDVEGSKGDTLDEELWGDEGKDDDTLKEEENSQKKDSGEVQMVPKDDNLGKDSDDKSEDISKEENRNEKEINEMEDLPCDSREFDESEMNEKPKEEQEAPEKLDIPENISLDDLDEPNENEENDHADDSMNMKENQAEDMNLEDENEQISDDLNEPNEDREMDSNPENVQEDVAEDDVENQSSENTNLDDKSMQPEGMADDMDPSKKAEDTQNMVSSAIDSGHGETDKDVDLKMANQKMEAASINDQQSSEDQDNAGLSESHNLESGHQTDKAMQASHPKNMDEHHDKHSKKPGKSDERRNVAKEAGDQIVEDASLKEIDDNSEVNQIDKKESGINNMYQHIKDTNDAWDATVKDAATEHQQQEIDENDLNDPDNGETLPEGADKDPFISEVETLLSQQVKPSVNDPKVCDNKDDNAADENDDAEEMKVDDNVVNDLPNIASKLAESSIHTDYNLNNNSSFDLNTLRCKLREEIGLLYVENSTHETASLWDQMNMITGTLSQELCEELRLILEPSQATKLKGDFRTGKRLNMRKVIPYVASEFRKDKIWLRRTKPSKREYQIMIALDDSSSMSDNHSKQMAFESLSMISNALTKLEAGEIGVVSFGETISLLHPFEKSFSHEAGASVMGQFTFSQKKTYIVKMLKNVLPVMLKSRLTKQNSFLETSQLLLIISDGRGLFGEGVEKVNQTVRKCCQAGVFIVFIILDNPSLKDSIFDIRIPMFKEGSALPEFKPYLDCFPFPFYLILKDITHLPRILSQALSQWFEMVTASDR